MNEVIKLTNKYVILVTLLILYSLISAVYLFTARVGSYLNVLIVFILFILMAVAFISGWFNMIKVAVKNPDYDGGYALIKEFLPGVGEYFLPVLGGFFNLAILNYIIYTIFIFIGIKTIGLSNISPNVFIGAMQTPESFNTFLTTLPLTFVAKWTLLLTVTVITTYLFMFLYFPALFFKSKNPFIAFFIGLKDLFSAKFFKSLGLLLLISFVYGFLSVSITFSSANIILYFLLTLIKFYIITSIGIGIFYYYYNNFIKPQIGKNIDTRI